MFFSFQKPRNLIWTGLWQDFPLNLNLGNGNKNQALQLSKGNIIVSSITL